MAAVSTSGPLIASAAAPALAIAFWRMAMASGVLVPVSVVAARRELRMLGRRERGLAVAAGVLLAGHFATWIPSVRFTTVASAAALVCTQPIWAALLAHAEGHRISARAWTGITVAVAGAAAISGFDVTVSGRALVGDVLAIVGGAFAAAYMAAGNRVRQSVSTTTYTTVCYLGAAVALLVVCAVAREPLAGYPGDAWLRIAALTIGAQFLGHSMFNRALRRTSPTLVSLAILFEVPGATFLAWVWLDQRPPAGAVPGLVLLVVGVAIVLAARDRSIPPAVPAE